MADDARSLPNTAMLETSFLYGANATFVEEMAARYARDWAIVRHDLDVDEVTVAALHRASSRAPRW